MIAQGLKNAMMVKNQAIGQARQISRSAIRQSEEHHEHLVFEGQFSKKSAAILCWSVLLGGVGVPVIALKFQNWKHGFPVQE